MLAAVIEPGPLPPATDGWRQPPPPGEPAAGRGLRRRLAEQLARTFEETEDENKRVILAAVGAGPARDRLLDLGCFNGAFTADLARVARAVEVVGVEWLPEHAAAARRHGVEVVETDLEAPLPFPDASFGLVHANQVIEHLRHTDQFLAECARVCALDGRVVLSTNNLAAWHNVGSLVLGFQPFPNHVSDEVHVGNPLDPRRGLHHADRGQTHLRVFTVRALSELAAVHGLETESVHMNGYYPLPPRFARRAVRLDARHAAFMVVVLRRRAEAVRGAPPAA